MPNESQELKKLYPHKFKTPQIHASAMILPSAQVMGDVHIGAESSVWFHSVIRGDVNFIRIGEKTNIQDGSIIHVSYRKSPTNIGNCVTVGHSVTLHACTLRDFVLVGMGSVVLDDAELGEFVLLGAGSLVTPGTKIPAYSKAFGRPAKVVSKLTEAEIESIRWNADHYVKLAASYRFS